MAKMSNGKKKKNHQKEWHSLNMTSMTSRKTSPSFENTIIDPAVTLSEMRES